MTRVCGVALGRVRSLTAFLRVARKVPGERDEVPR